MKERKDIVEYEDAPSGAIKLYNYKEPFMPVKEGFGFMGVLMHDAEEQLVQCHICGEWMRSLSAHVKVHGFANTSHYKKTFGLSQSTALVCEEVRNQLIEQGKETMKKFNGKMPNGGGFKKGHKAGFKKSLEKRNNSGTCPLQLLDKLDRIKWELGHIPNFSEVHRIKTLGGKPFSGVGLTKSLTYVFGSWENAVAQLNWTGIDRQENRKWTKQSLIESFRQFVKKNKRFPSGSDCRRGTFPSKTAFMTHCGGLEKVKKDFMEEMIKNI